MSPSVRPLFRSSGAHYSPARIPTLRLRRQAAAMVASIGKIASLARGVGYFEKDDRARGAAGTGRGRGRRTPAWRASPAASPRPGRAPPGRPAVLRLTDNHGGLSLRDGHGRGRPLCRPAFLPSPHPFDCASFDFALPRYAQDDRIITPVILLPPVRPERNGVESKEAERERSRRTLRTGVDRISSRHRARPRPVPLRCPPDLRHIAKS